MSGLSVHVLVYTAGIVIGGGGRGGEEGEEGKPRERERGGAGVCVG